MAIVTIDARDRTPIYAQLERGAAGGDRDRPARGRAISCRPSGSSPSTCSVNANTVARVYAELERAGVLETRRGVGSFVSATPPSSAPAARARSAAARLRDPSCWPTPTPPASPWTI